MRTRADFYSVCSLRRFCIINVGDVVDAERDDGAGILGFGLVKTAQYCNMMQLMNLYEEMEEWSHTLDAAGIASMCHAIDTALHASTNRSKLSASLAASNLVAEVSKLALAHTASKAAVGIDGRVAEVRLARKRGGKDKRGAKKRRSLAAEIDVVAEAETEKITYEDKLGAIGPGGKKRMAGGNPQGRKCRDWDGTKGSCKYNFCPFSHKHVKAE